MPWRALGLWDVEALHILLDSRLSDCGKVVSPTRRPPFTPRKIPGTHFCWRLSHPQGHSAAGRISWIEKSSDFIGNRTHDLPTCSIVSQPITLPRTPKLLLCFIILYVDYISITVSKLRRPTHYSVLLRTVCTVSCVWLKSRELNLSLIYISIFAVNVRNFTVYVLRW
jgi:hypothetical protein